MIPGSRRSAREKGQRAAQNASPAQSGGYFNAAVPGRSSSGWLARAITLPARHIHWKILLPFAALSVGIALAGSAVVTRLVSDSLEERFSARLAGAGDEASGAIVADELQHRSVLDSIASVDGVVSAVDSRDRQKLAALVEPIVANYRTDLVEVLDPQGVRLLGLVLADPASRTYANLNDNSARGTWPIVRRVASGAGGDPAADKPADIVSTPQGIALYTAAPVYRETHLVAIVLAGTRLDSILPVAKNEAVADVTVYDTSGLPLASTFPAEREGGVREVMRPAVPGASAPRPGAREQRTVLGRTYEVAYGQLEIAHVPVGLYSIALPTSIASSAGVARWSAMRLLGLAAVAVFLVGAATAWLVGAPLRRVANAARAAASADPPARTGLHGRDEIGRIAAAVDAMADRIQRQHLATLETLVTALDSTVPGAHGHCVRVGQLAVAIGEALGVDAAGLDDLQVGGYLHDVAGLAFRDEVHRKRATVLAGERHLLELHPRIGLGLLDVAELAPRLASASSETHHVAPQSALLRATVAAADLSDALRNVEPLRSKLDQSAALAIMENEVRDGVLPADVVAAMAAVLAAWSTQDPAMAPAPGDRSADEGEAA